MPRQQNDRQFAFICAHTFSFLDVKSSLRFRRPGARNDLEIRPGGVGDDFRLPLRQRCTLTRSAPTPRADAPASRKLAAVCSVTPPVGTSRRNGNGALSDFR